MSAPPRITHVSGDVIEKDVLKLVPEGQLTVTLLHPQMQVIESKTFRMPDEANQAGKWSAEKNMAGFNVHWGVNQSRKANARSKELDLTYARYCWADIDPRVNEFGSLAAARQKLMNEAFPAVQSVASLVIDSGNGLQALFRLTDPLAIETPDQLEAYKSVNVAIGRKYLGGGTHNADRILRVPGTLNFPSAAKLKKGYASTPVISRVMRDNSLNYTLSELGILAGGKSHPPATYAPNRANSSGLGQRFEMFLARNAKAADRFGGDRSGLNDGSGSGMDMSLYAMMKDAGFNKLEISTLLCDWEYGSDNGRAQGSRYWDRLEEKTTKSFVIFGQRKEGPSSKRDVTTLRNGSHDAGITAEELSKKTFPPLTWVVQDILPEGCFILSARPKVGKSWLALQISLAVAHGFPTLGKQVVQGKAIYLALEDNQRRLQDRLKQLMPQGYATPNLILHTGWPKFDAGGLEQLVALIERERPKLITIDTLAKVRPAQTSSHVYQNDYAALAPLTEIASRFRCCIVVVHHNRKGKSEIDAVEQISGSLGLSGAVDGMLVIDGVRSDKQYKLSLIGRDIPTDDELAISRQSNGEWQVLGQASQVFIGQERKEVSDLLALHPSGLRPKEIAELLAKKGGTVRKLLVAMVQDRQLHAVKGVYTHPSPIGNSSSVSNGGNSGNAGNS